MLKDGYQDVPAGKIASVVTSLEMATRPTPHPEPAARWQLVRHERPDPHWYRDLYHRVGAQWLWFSRLRLPLEDLAAIIQHPDVEVYAVRHGGSDEGLLELDFRTPDVCELAFFGLTSALIGTGAGRWLMNRATEAAWVRPISRLWVHTCTLDHPGALDFYRRAGFVPVHRQVEIADDPRQLGVLARDVAPQVPLL